MSKEFYSAWIDYNQNGQFENEEKIFSIDSLLSSSYEVDVEIPSNALVGQTRLRVILAFNREPRSCDFNDFVFGEVEDYCFEIMKKTSPCDIELTLQADEIRNNTIDLSWANNEAAIGYDLRYQSESTSWQSLITFTNTSSITGLEPCTLYEFQSRLVCGSDTSSYSESVFYETLCSTATIQTEIDPIQIFPNPVRSNVNLESPLSIDHVTIYNSDGKRVNQIKTNRGNLTSLNLQNLEPGMYMLKIKIEDKYQIKKIIKL